jgi:nucleoside-diphosphate-sugar epimerase
MADAQNSETEAKTRVVIIGGTGHVGTYLVPRLVKAGYEVISISRGQQQPYRPDPAWKSVQQIKLDRLELEKKETFGEQVRQLQPAVVIDMICFTTDSNRHLVEALRGQVKQFIHCGTTWVHGPSTEVPMTEEQPRRPFSRYGIQKAAIEADLLREARYQDFPATVLHPGHIVGPGWEVINPAGHLKVELFTQLGHGEEVVLPNIGMETLHHVHADDVAQAFMLALLHWDKAVGESFHVVSPAALTLRGYAEAVAAWFGQPARLRFLPWPEWSKTVSAEDAAITWDHIAHSPNYSIAKAQRLLGYQPRYRSLEAIYEAVEWLIEQGQVTSALPKTPW